MKAGPLAEHPFELLFGLLAFVAGLGLTLGAVGPASLHATLPFAVVKAWGLVQLLAGALIVTGIVMRYARPPLLVIGLRLERAGLVPLAAAATVYGVVALGYAGPRAIYPVAVLLAVALACLSRVRTIARLERTIRKHSNLGDTGGD